MKDIEFIVDNLRLKGNLFYPEKVKNKNPGILFIHGWTSEKKRSFQYAEALIKLGFIVMVFDMRGHGISKGNINIATPKEFLKDCIMAYDYFAMVEGVDRDNISIVSSSFGGYLSSILSLKRKIKNLVLRAPADYPNNTFEKSKMGNGSNLKKKMNWRLIPKKTDETFALQALHNFDGKVLIIESGKDDVIPHQVLQNYINAAKDKNKLNYITIKDAPHSIKDGPFKNEITRILVNWFGKKF